MQQSPYLTVADVASELGITPGGVYKLIERGKLKAIRRTERNVRVPRLALDAYRRRVQAGHNADWHLEDDAVDLRVLRAEFERETGMSPADWEGRWKDDAFEDTPENMGLAIRALALRPAEASSGSEEAEAYLATLPRRVAR